MPSDTPYRLLYQAYGDAGVLAECKYALLRLAAVYAPQTIPFQVVVYTDQPAYFRQAEAALPLVLIAITHQQVAAWKGTIGFVHRVKIEVIRDCLARFGGKVLYADTDTFCLQPVAPLMNAVHATGVVMHNNEGSLNQPLNLHFKKWKRFLLRHPALLPGAVAATHTTMWNAGVIGLQHSHLPLLGNVLSLTDKIYPLFSRHTVEQFSFCYTFQKENFHIKPAEAYFFHYWNLKEFRQVLLSFFEKNKAVSFGELMLAALELQPVALLQNKIAFQNPNPAVKLMRKLLRKKWQPDTRKG